jgi:hypothetical protein
LILAAVAAGLASTWMSPPARAQTQSVGIRLVDAPTNRTGDPRARLYIVDHLAPGSTITRRVEVSNDTDRAQTIQLYAGAATVAAGSFQFGDGRAADDLTGWTRVDPSSLTMVARAKRLATVTIAVPRKASAGERYGVVWAEAAAPAPRGGGIATANRVGVRIYLSVGPGGEPPTDFVITTFEARRAPDGSPLVAATVRNSGGRALDLSGALSLTHGPGGLSTGPFNVKLGTTLGVGQTEPVLVTLDRAVPAGPWHARIVLRSGTTQREATATITFPAAADSSAGPTRAHAERGGLWSLLLGAAVAFSAAVVAAAYTLIRRRRRLAPRSSTPAP